MLTLSYDEISGIWDASRAFRVSFRTDKTTRRAMRQDIRSGNSLRFHIDLKIDCFDPTTVFDAAVAAAERAQISREMYVRARDASIDHLAFDIKALLILTTPVPGCDATVDGVRRTTCLPTADASSSGIDLDLLARRTASDRGE